MGPSVTSAGPLRRWADRTGAFVLDGLLIAYGAWCVQRLAVAVDPSADFLARHPGLLVCAPLLAALWQGSGRSLAQRGHGLDLVGPEDETDARRARRRHLWALLVGVEVALVAVAFHALAPHGGGLAVLLGALGLSLVVGLALGASLPERLAGLALVRRRHAPPLDVRPWHRRPNGWALGILLALTFAVGVVVTRFDLGRVRAGWGKASDMIGRLLSPDGAILERSIGEMVETIYIALMASTLAIPFAAALAFVGARNLTRGSLPARVGYVLARVLMNLTRSIEPLVWAIIFVLWVGVGPFSGTLALFVHSVAALGKLYSEAIESIDPGPVEAIRATGASFPQVLRYGVVPQVVPAFLAFTVYRWDINVRMATVLGLIGGGGIGYALLDAVQLSRWEKVGTIGLLIVLVVWALDFASSKVRARLT